MNVKRILIWTAVTEVLCLPAIGQDVSTTVSYRFLEIVFANHVAVVKSPVFSKGDGHNEIRMTGRFGDDGHITMTFRVKYEKSQISLEYLGGTMSKPGDILGLANQALEWMRPAIEKELAEATISTALYIETVKRLAGQHDVQSDVVAELEGLTFQVFIIDSAGGEPIPVRRSSLTPSETAGPEIDQVLMNYYSTPDQRQGMLRIRFMNVKGDTSEDWSAAVIKSLEGDDLANTGHVYPGGEVECQFKISDLAGRTVRLEIYSPGTIFAGFSGRVHFNVPAHGDLEVVVHRKGDGSHSPHPYREEGHSGMDR